MLAAQVTLFLAAVVWGAVSLKRGSLFAGCLMLIASGVLFGRDFLTFDVGPATMSIDRLMVVALVLAYVIHRSFACTDPKPLCPADYLLLALLMWLTISAFSHGAQARVAVSANPFWRLFAGYWMPAALYWVMRQSRLNEKSVGKLHLFLAILGVYLAVTGILEITGQWWLVFPRYIADPEVGIHFGRARGPMGNSVRYGLYVCVCLFAGWAYWHQLSRGWQRSSLLLVPLFLAAVFFTYTRSVWLGLAAGGCIVAALTLHGRVRVAVLGSAIGVGLLVCVVNWQRLVFLEREESGEHAAVSATNRAAHAYVSWKIFKDRPLTGCGFGQYPVAKLSYLNDRNTRLNIHRLRNRVSHNTILTLLAEVGVVGLALYLTLLIAWTNDAVAIWRAPGVPPWARRHAVVFLAALSVYLMQALFHEVTYRSHINAIMFTLAAVTTGLRSGELQEPLLTRAESPRSFPPCDEPQSP